MKPTGPLRVVQASFPGNQFRLPSQAGHPGVVQRAAGASWAPLPDGVLRLRPPGTGERLPPAVQAKMEGLFRTDLSGVRVHVGPEAAALGALAFTHRTDIYFAPGQYAPHSAHGERLLAHELTHVVQQRAGRVRCPAGSGVAVVHDLGLEAEAERMGALVASSARAVAPRAQPLQARLAPAPPPRPVAAPSRILPPPPHRQAQTAAAIQPFGLWLAGKILDWTDPNWRRRGAIVSLERETRALYAGLSGDIKRRPKVRQLAARLSLIDAAHADPSSYSDIRNELGGIASELRDEETLGRRLAKTASHFERTGRSFFEAQQAGVADLISEPVWDRLTELGRDIPKVKKKARLGQERALASLTYHLFQKFISAGFQYQIMQSRSANLIGVSSNTREGNCVAYATAFANVLTSFGIDAEAKYIREEDQGRFIVRLDQFIDPMVRGHIYVDQALQTGYYMFNSHAATWVPLLGKYFDPMACASYTSLTPYIECELDSSADDAEFRPSTRPRTLLPHRDWKLIRVKAPEMRGGFPRLRLVDDD